MKLIIVPAKGTAQQDIANLAADLAKAGLSVTVAPACELPPDAFDPARGQFRAEDLLLLAEELEGPRLLLVADADLYADDLNFAFGIAEAPGRAAILSFARLRAGADPQRLREWALKEAMHELGHTFGLRHCPDVRCVMHFSNSLADTDRKSARFCSRCRDRSSLV